MTLPGLVRRRRAEAQLFGSKSVELVSDKRQVFASEAEASALSEFAYPPIPLARLGGDRDLVIAIQKRLTELGYLDPPADGKFGPMSSWALSEFCYLNGLSLANGFTREIAARLADPKVLLPDIAPSRSWLDYVIAYMQAEGHWICRHSAAVNVVYLEGMNPDGTLNDDRPNFFNDLRVAFSIDADGMPRMEAWEGTTEPGIFWTLNPMNPGGAARIAFGQYKSWIVGTHRAGRSGAHEALVQVEPVTVYRDLNKDYQRTGDRTDKGLFGINQHWGYDSPKDDLGHTSAGCLVGRSREGHKQFMALVKSDPRYLASQAYRFMAAILPGDKIGAR